VLIILGSGAEFIDARRPLGQAARNGRGRFAPDPDCLNDRLPINSVGDRTPHPHIVEGGLIVPQVDGMTHRGQEILKLQVGMGLLH
jgi:hypothetical protein